MVGGGNTLCCKGGTAIAGVESEECAAVAVADVARSFFPVLDVGDEDAEGGCDAVLGAACVEEVGDDLRPVDSWWFNV